MKILFLCVANSARSQMAEGLARQLAPHSSQIYSAGSRPGRLHPLAVQAMARMDIDISAQHSKGIDEVPLGGIDMVVTLCAEEVCPVPIQGARRLHWPIDDPAGHADEPMEHQLARFMSARDAIKTRLAELFPATPSAHAALPATGGLKIIKGPAKGKRLALQGEVLTLGRGEDNDLQVADLSISRNHLRLSAYKDGWRLEDLGTANGTRVDGRRTMQAILRSGSKICTGDTVFEYLNAEDMNRKQWRPFWRSKPKEQPSVPKPISSPMAEHATVAVPAIAYQRPPKARRWLLWALLLVGALIISISLALHFAGRTRQQRAESRVEALRKDAEQSLRESRWQAARQGFSEVLALAPDDPSARRAIRELDTAKARYRETLALADKGDYEVLRRTLESFQPGQPYHPEAQLSLQALIQAQNEKKTPAVRQSSPIKVGNKKPAAQPRKAQRQPTPASKGAPASLDSGLQHYRAGRFDAAATAFAQAASTGVARAEDLKQAVTRLKGNLEQGTKALQAGRIEEAIPALTEALRQDKQLGAAFSASIRARLADALVRQGNAALARKALVPAARAVAKALGYDRKHPQALALVEALEQRGRALLIEAVASKNSRPAHSRQLAKTVTRITSTKSQTHLRAKAFLAELSE